MIKTHEKGVNKSADGDIWRISMYEKRQLLNLNTKWRNAEQRDTRLYPFGWKTWESQIMRRIRYDGRICKLPGIAGGRINSRHQECVPPGPEIPLLEEHPRCSYTGPQENVSKEEAECTDGGEIINKRPL